MARKNYTKRKRKSNKTRRKYNRKKKIRKTKRAIKGGGKKFDELLAEIYLNRDLILGLGNHPKPLPNEELYSLSTETEKSVYDPIPVNNDPNEYRIEKYMRTRKFWRNKKKKSKKYLKKYKNGENNGENNGDNMNVIHIESGSSAASLAALGI